MNTDTSEKGIETLIVRSLIDEAGYVPGDSEDYDLEYPIMKFIPTPPAPRNK
ncbi:MAG: hypothetical protein HQL74_15340 [Magnetococcales bacterium]|nr:hypothetical protein [Magnetococcales bacterium]